MSVNYGVDRVGEESSTHSLYSQKYKENIPCHKKSEFYCTPSVVFKLCNSKMKLSFAGCAMWESKSFLLKTKQIIKINDHLLLYAFYESVFKCATRSSNITTCLDWSPVIKAWTMHKLLSAFTHAWRDQFIIYLTKT